mgnify:CR=1 FL=1
MPQSELSRRALLSLAVLPACGVSPSPPDSEPIPLPLRDYPSLAEPGGSAVVSLPSALLELMLIHVAPDDYRALWRICSHGACTVEYDAGARQLVCPCHGSRFDESGAVTLGPARSPLRRFDVWRSGDTLLLQRRS